MLKMLVFLAVVAFLGIAAGGPIDSVNPLIEGKTLINGRIVGGKATSIKELPYQVSIRKYEKHNCGGSIISKNWVLTAAHCMKYKLSILSIRAGAYLHHTGGSIHSIDRAIDHEDYGFNDNGFPYNDISAVHVVEPFVFDETRQPIPIFRTNEVSQPGVYSVVSGWGDTKESVSRDMLRSVSLPIISKKDCRKALSSYGELPEGEICAGFRDGGKDSCQGDSGGPLAIDKRLAGIVSWGIGCADANLPGVYTEVAHFRDWIRNSTGI